MNESDRRIRPEVRQQFFTFREVGEMLGVSQRTVSQWVKDGKLLTHKIGDRQKVFIDDLDRFVREGNK